MRRLQRQRGQLHLARVSSSVPTPRPSSARVSILTFNQGEAWKSDRPPTADELHRLHELLDRLVGAPRHCHLLVLGLQEANSTVPTLVQTYLGARHSNQYRVIVQEQRSQLLLGTLQLWVWAHTSLVLTTPPTTDHYTCANPVVRGFETVSGATFKGGLRASLDLRSLRLPQLNLLVVHLPSNAAHIQERTQCLVNMLTTMRDVAPDAQVMVFGDMNYRTSQQNTLVSPEEKRQVSEYRCTRGRPNPYLAQDQLRHALLTDRALRALKLREADIRFCPTCRYKETHDAERGVRSYDERRAPSYCDRILFSFANAIRLVEYQSVFLSSASDHDAVYARFEIAVTAAPPTAQ